MKHELIEVGLYDYSDLDKRLNKPVKWTSDDLRQIAENYRGGIPLTSEHDKVYIGIGNNIVFEEDKGKLFIDLPDELDMKGKGLSPKVDVLLKDNGDSFGIDTMNLIDVGVTKNPRKITLLNSEITGQTERQVKPQILSLLKLKTRMQMWQPIFCLKNFRERMRKSESCRMR
ncbi:MAG: hypothetical protein IJL02_09425 [Methanobrevibacter sp.]|uniref:hypothetical protein n=1 Tax=Methanobrevibacter sp. TaxID=66852 RepID=UPI0025E5E63D|nr:hypothetical protein [Methanobrevibacter sp.]MBQ6100060.1 hypothetical protein [Methanobrevibacter sp.]